MDTRQTTLRYHLRAQALSHGIKAIGGGGLVGGALVFPIAYHESVWLQAATLGIFLACATGFGALHRASFITFPYPTMVTLVILCAVVIGSNPTRNELVPYLPVVLATLIILTVVGDDVLQKRRLSQRATSPEDGRPEDEPPAASDSRWSGGSDRTFSPQPGSDSPIEHEWNGHLLLDRYESQPLSRLPNRPGTDSSDISLPGAAGQYREGWHPLTQGFFQDLPLPGQVAREESQAAGGPQARGNASPDGGAKPQEDSCSEACSDRGTVYSSDPLLGSPAAASRS